MKLSAKVLPGLLPLFMAGLLTGLAPAAYAKHGSFGGSVMEALDEVVQGRESTSLPSHGTVEIAFSPNGACTAATMRFIGEAKHSIRLAAYGLTSSPIGQALVRPKNAASTCASWWTASTTGGATRPTA